LKLEDHRDSEDTETSFKNSTISVLDNCWEKGTPGTAAASAMDEWVALVNP
jgi:hypothetical protein